MAKGHGFGHAPFLYCEIRFVCIVLFDFAAFAFKIGLMNESVKFRECSRDGGVIEDEGLTPKTLYARL